MDFLWHPTVQFYIASYLIGGIPFGLLLAKYVAKTDIRNSGSGSIGATNVLRVLKESNPALAKKLAILTLFLDALKGIAVLLVAKMLGASLGVQWALAVFAVLGHCYSPYLKFDGGKGVATGAGVMFVMLPLPTLLALIAWGVAGKALKISSLSSLIALATLWLAAYLLNPTLDGLHTHAPIGIIAFIILYKHIPNIVRLFKGAEKQVV